MVEHPLGNRFVSQIGIMVSDIEQSVETYSRVFGVDKPPIIITDDYEQAHTNFKGEASHAKAKLAFFNMGQVQIELIEPIGEPSTWEKNIAFVVPDTDAAIQHLAEQGMAVDQKGDYTGGRYTYIDSVPQLGVALELLENFNK